MVRNDEGERESEIRRSVLLKGSREEADFPSCTDRRNDFIQNERWSEKKYGQVGVSREDRAAKSSSHQVRICKQKDEPF